MPKSHHRSRPFRIMLWWSMTIIFRLPPHLRSKITRLIYFLRNGVPSTVKKNDSKWCEKRGVRWASGNGCVHDQQIRRYGDKSFWVRLSLKIKKLQTRGRDYSKNFQRNPLHRFNQILSTGRMLTVWWLCSTVSHRVSETQKTVWAQFLPCLSKEPGWRLSWFNADRDQDCPLESIDLIISKSELKCHSIFHPAHLISFPTR